MYLHMGEEVDGVDMRAEVGLLSRNLVVMGEMEDACYPYTKHVCSFFDFDTFGGHIKVWVCLPEAHGASPWAGFSVGKGTEGRSGERNLVPCSLACRHTCQGLGAGGEASKGTSSYSPVTRHTSRSPPPQ